MRFENLIKSISVKKLSENRKLITALKSGSEKAFTEIYNKYWKKLLAISYHILKDKEQAQEVVQEVFISIWNNRKEIEIDSIEGYLATAVKYSTFKVIYKNKRLNEIEQGLQQADSYLEDDKIEARFLKDYLDGVIEKLPEKCRIIFKLSRETYLTNQEISDNLNISVKTVEAHITRAIKILRINLHKVGLSLVFLLLF
ncbi:MULTISPECIES: RNA polymerase sigma-70 factor [Sphingobacterium]|uniref:RNA polymerase sigma-70 factor n=1 Tax=Sphingobacterium tenebrionis TaxID=3111775 RepID=A0ABU8I213_9SPHI|nr:MULTISPECIES: RNA polymerase sigma-70 factor [unclassified Sphingobacterium]QBR13667.1 RNA polymerase sigma-70 factor [Sphingobacterium sp. CZ-2]